MDYMKYSTPRIINDRYAHVRRGTMVQMEGILDIPVGATVIAMRKSNSISEGVECVVTSVSNTKVEFMCRSRKFNMKPYDFISTMKRRVGPVVEESIQRGLTVRATCDGRFYSEGDILTLTEASGDCFSFKGGSHKSGSIERQELLVTCKYV